MKTSLYLLQNARIIKPYSEQKGDCNKSEKDDENIHIRSENIKVIIFPLPKTFIYVLYLYFIVPFYDHQQQMFFTLPILSVDDIFYYN